MQDMASNQLFRVCLWSAALGRRCAWRCLPAPGTAVRATTQISVAPSNVLSVAAIHSDGRGSAKRSVPLRNAVRVHPRPGEQIAKRAQAIRCHTANSRLAIRQPFAASVERKRHRPHETPARHPRRNEQRNHWQNQEGQKAEWPKASCARRFRTRHSRSSDGGRSTGTWRASVASRRAAGSTPTAATPTRCGGQSPQRPPRRRTPSRRATAAASRRAVDRRGRRTPQTRRELGAAQARNDAGRGPARNGVRH